MKPTLTSQMSPRQLIKSMLDLLQFQELSNLGTLSFLVSCLQGQGQFQTKENKTVLQKEKACLLLKSLILTKSLALMKTRYLTLTILIQYTTRMKHLLMGYLQIIIVHFLKIVTNTIPKKNLTGKHTQTFSCLLSKTVCLNTSKMYQQKSIDSIKSTHSAMHLSLLSLKKAMLKTSSLKSNGSIS